MPLAGRHLSSPFVNILKQLQNILVIMKTYLNLRFALLTFFLLSTLITIGQTNKPYTGYRVYLANLKVLSQTDEMLKIAFRTVNTGRQDLEFGQENTESMQKMVVRFDPALEQGKMQPHLQDIITALKRQEFAVVAGKISPERKMEVKLTYGNSGAAPAPSEIVSTTPTAIEETAPIIKEETPIIIEEEEPIVETTPTPKDGSAYYDPETCPDLKIEAIRVAKQKKNYVIIEYTIKNTGKGPANIEGDSKSQDDNIAVKAFMTSSSKLNKGALVLGGDVVGNRSKNAGPLMPGETYTTKIRLETSTMTKFTPVIILELDTFSQVRECDETNNKNHIKIR